MAGLVPAIPIGKAMRLSDRDHRDKPGDDKVEFVVPELVIGPKAGPVGHARMTDGVP
jgi:hypothetical protein